ncbi:MAG: hypothetical protein R3A80_06850 [Bdellovibrionota bacterium]
MIIALNIISQIARFSFFVLVAFGPTYCIAGRAQSVNVFELLLTNSNQINIENWPITFSRKKTVPLSKILAGFIGNVGPGEGTTTRMSTLGQCEQDHLDKLIDHCYVAFTYYEHRLNGTADEVEATKKQWVNLVKFDVKTDPNVSVVYQSSIAGLSVVPGSVLVNPIN